MIIQMVQALKRYYVPFMLAFLCAGIVYGFTKMHLHHFFYGLEELEQLSVHAQNNIYRPEPEMPFSYIAHAGGGYAGKSYLNNLEALNNSYRLGVTYIEIDFNYTSDSVVVLAHDFVPHTAKEFLNDKKSGTHLTLDDLLDWLTEKELLLVTDIKVDNIKILKYIAKVRPQLCIKIIPQVYSISEIQVVKKMGYKKVIFTNYLSQYPNIIIKKLASTDILFAITLPYDGNFKMLQFFNDLKEMRTPVFTHTINDKRKAKELLRSGCKGIYTDFLLLPSN